MCMVGGHFGEAEWRAAHIIRTLRLHAIHVCRLIFFTRSCNCAIYFSLLLLLPFRRLRMRSSAAVTLVTACYHFLCSNLFVVSSTLIQYSNTPFLPPPLLLTQSIPFIPCYCSSSLKRIAAAPNAKQNGVGVVKPRQHVMCQKRRRQTPGKKGAETFTAAHQFFSTFLLPCQPQALWERETVARTINVSE